MQLYTAKDDNGSQKAWTEPAAFDYVYNMSTNDSAEILRTYHERKRKEGRHFSLRSLAKRLEVSVSLLSLVLKGKRNLPLRLIDPLCRLLDIDQVDRDRLVSAGIKAKGGPSDRATSLYFPATKKKSSGRKLRWDTLAKGETEFLTDWKDIAIFLCCGLKDSDGSPEFVARKLFLGLGEVNQKMKRLRDAGFLDELNDGPGFQRGKQSLQFRSGKDFSLIRRYHRAHLENAAWSLEQNVSEADVLNRLITGMSVTISRKSVPQLKEKLHEFLLEIAEFTSGETPEEVYQLGLQFFPLSRVGVK